MQSTFANQETMVVDFNLNLFTDALGKKPLQMLNLFDQVKDSITKRFKTKPAKPKFIFRPIAEGDTDLVFQLHENLSPRSKRLRFNTCLAACTDSFLNQLSNRITGIDSNQGFGTIIIDPASKAAIGIAYVVLDSKQGGELALVINDNFQNKGLGSKLFKMLLDQSYSHKLKSLTAYVCDDNSGMQRLIKNSKRPVAIHSMGSTTEFQLYL